MYTSSCAISQASVGISLQFTRLSFARLYYIAMISVIATQSPFSTLDTDRVYALELLEEINSIFCVSSFPTFTKMLSQFMGDRMAKKGGFTQRHKSRVYFVTKLAVLCFGQGSLILIVGTIFNSLSLRTRAHLVLDLLQHIFVSLSWKSNFKFIRLAICYFIAQCCLRSLDVLCH